MLSKVTSLMLPVLFAFVLLPVRSAAAQKSVEITTSMRIDVDGAPSAYGPSNKVTLDYELNAHKGATADGEIVGYITKKDGRTPEVQGPNDPHPGYYISTSAFYDRNNPNRCDPNRYVDASKINYVVLGNVARSGGVSLGDFVAVYSKTTHKSVFGIVGDSGNSSGAEGSLALLQALGYPFKDGKTGEVEEKQIVVRYFPNSNPNHRFYSTQSEIDERARSLGLDRAFPARGEPRENLELKHLQQTAARIASTAAKGLVNVSSNPAGADFHLTVMPEGPW
jgi:Fungal chitosanase of glycosyl hydrolase group 75